MDGVVGVGNALAGIIGQAPETTFVKVFGSLKFYYGDGPSPYLELGGMFGRTAIPYGIAFKKGVVTPRLIGHELGHAFDRRMWIKNGNSYAEDAPTNQLNRGLYIKVDPTNIDTWIFITGIDTYGSGQYKRNNGIRGTESGYGSDTYPCQYHYYKPNGGLMDQESESAGEEFADIFLNWSLGGFVNNTRGNLLKNWMNTNMPNWIALASK